MLIALRQKNQQAPEERHGQYLFANLHSRDLRSARSTKSYSTGTKEELHKYITGIVTHQGQKLLAIHCMPDHTHALIGLRPNKALSDLVGDMKTGSINHINENRWVLGRFAWQEGFGAFSYAHSQLTTVIRYIQNQEKHHQQRTFREEYLQFLQRFRVPYEERYLFEMVEQA